MTETTEIVTDEEIELAHHGNFGTMPKRRVVDEGVLKYAFGYSSGSTQLTILIEHGLVRKPKPGSYHTTLTKKGQAYLRALKGACSIEQILDGLGVSAFPSPPKPNADMDMAHIYRARDTQNFDAYYYSFQSTGSPDVDLILAAVAYAGSRYHNTENWGEDDNGPSCIDLIQEAANRAALFSFRKWESGE